MQGSKLGVLTSDLRARRGLRAEGLRFRVEGLGFRAEGLRLRV